MWRWEIWRLVYINLAQAIKNSFGEEGKELFVKFTRDAFESGVGTYNKCEEADTKYDTIKTDTEFEKPLVKGSLHYWAKVDNSRLYQEHFPILNKVLQEQSTELLFEAVLSCQTEVSKARYFNNLYGKEFVCTDVQKKHFYEFTKNCLWVKNDGGTPLRNIISNEMKDTFVTETKRCK